MAERRRDLGQEQHWRWEAAYTAHPGMYGRQPSAAAVYAAGVFHRMDAQEVLELGAGHGRDAVFLARQGLTVRAMDFSATGLGQLLDAARLQGVAERITTTVHDVRDPLPLPDDSVDAAFAHMLLSMALTTDEIHGVVAEVRRVLRPGGVFVYTVRHRGDAHYGSGTAHGDDIFEYDGFAVHFFSHDLVDALAEGWILQEVHAFEEGDLPRRLWRVTQALPRCPAGRCAHRRAIEQLTTAGRRWRVFHLCAPSGEAARISLTVSDRSEQPQAVPYQAGRTNCGHIDSRSWTPGQALRVARRSGGTQ
ncbi:class I SAM-dependent methyltransferase [Streptomyces sp. NPDC002078]